MLLFIEVSIILYVQQYHSQAINRNIMDSHISHRSQGQTINRCINDSQLNISIINQPNQSQHILVRLTNVGNIDVYQLKIDEHYLNEIMDKSFSPLFPLPQILFEEMKEAIDSCSIRKNGLIAFNMSLGRKGSKELFFQLKKRNIDKFDFLVQRMMNNQKRHAEQIRLLKNQFSQYVIELKRDVSEQIAALKLQINNYQTTLLLTKSKGRNQKKTSLPINLTYDQQYDKKHKHRIVDEDSKKTQKITPVKRQAQHEKYSESIIQINSRQQASNERSLPICKAQQSQALQKTTQKADIQLLLPYERNLHGRFFDAKQGRNEVIITKKGNNGFFNYISKMVIPRNEVTTFVATQVKTKARYVMYGICTEGVLGVIDAFYRNQTLVLYSQSGWLYKNGEYSDSGTKIHDGAKIKISVNVPTKTISWMVNNKKTCSTQIPSHMLQRDLYFVLMMAHNDDTIKLHLQ